MSEVMEALRKEIAQYEGRYGWEEKFNMTKERSGRTLVLYIQALVERFGPEVYDLLGGVARQYAARRYRDIIKRLNIREKNPIGAVKCLSYVHTVGCIEGEVVEASPMRAVRIERKCPMMNIYTYDMCSRIVSLPVLQGICDAIGGNVVASHPRYLSRGDDVCEMVFEVKN
jgi:hypothetical protein